MRRAYHNNISFLDLLFNLLLMTIILLVVAVLHIVIENNKADIKTQAEFIITTTWDKQIDYDVDTWVQDPEGNILWYNQKEIGVMHLDRDDLGHLGNDWYFDEFGTAVYNPNQEIVTFRGIMAGEWIINLHLYRKGYNYDSPISVSVTFIKLHPKAKTVFSKKIQISEYWQEETVARVNITACGDVLSVEDGPKKKLVETKRERPIHP